MNEEDQTKKIIDITITPADSNPKALEYFRPFVRSYIEKHASKSEISAPAFFLSGFLVGSFCKLGNRDVRELENLWPGSNEDTFRDLLPHSIGDVFSPGVFDGVEPDFYLQPWGPLWIDIHDDIYWYHLRHETMPKNRVYFYYAKLYAMEQFGKLPEVIQHRLEAKLSSQADLDPSLTADLVMDREILMSLPQDTIQIS